MSHDAVVTVDLPPWAIASDARRAHIARVVALVGAWAEARGVSGAEAARWSEAARLHDALRDAAADALARWTPREGWPLGLWHGPAAAVAAERDGCADRGVLDAVRYHSVGWKDWDEAGRMLFLADYLEPGRSRERAQLDALAARVPNDSDAVFREVVERRLRQAERSGVARPETLALWQSLG